MGISLQMILSTLAMALREIRRNTLRSTLTTLGIVIGVAAVIALVTLGQGATDRVTADISQMGVNMLIVSPGAMRRMGASVTAAPLELADARAIERELPTVRAVAPAASRPSLAVYGNLNWNTLITGATDSYFDVRRLALASGRAFSEAELQSGSPVCVLGETVRRELFSRLDPLGASIRIGRISCQVIGVLVAKGRSTFGMDQDDFLLLPLSAYQRRIAGTDDIGSILVSAISEHATSKAKSQIEVLMRERRRIAPSEPDDFSVQDMREIAETLKSVTGVLTALLTAVAAVSLLVGGIGIMNIMLVSVTERTREIGIRLAIGARGREVLLQFLVEAVVLSVFGGVLGMMVGLVGSYLASGKLGLPFRILPEVIAIAFGFSVCVGVAFGFFPAHKASKLNPIEALRHE
jgi:putative ABC transport system permease protein